MADDRNDVIFEMWRARERRSYFLMSSAGAGIGYALATIAPVLSDLEKLIVVTALGLWSLSFIFGLRVLQLHRQEMNLSQEAIKFLRALPSQAISTAQDIIQDGANEMGPKIQFAHTAQVGLLLIGALTFAAIKLDLVADVLDWMSEK